jgi:hypothetical protein
MRDVKWFDIDELGPQPAGEHSPDRLVIGPPRHRLPVVITAVRVDLRPDAVAPGLSHGEVADHDLGGSQSQPHQLGRVVEVDHSHIVGQLVDAYRPASAGYLRKFEHRTIPVRQVAEGFPACRLGEPRQVPDVVVRVVDPSATLWSMLIEGMARVTRPCGRQVGKHAVSKQSDCSTPCFGVEGFKHGGGSGELQDVNRSGTVEVAVGAAQPSCRRSLPPDQSRTGNDVFQIDQ